MLTFMAAGRSRPRTPPSPTGGDPWTTVDRSVEEVLVPQDAALLQAIRHSGFLLALAL
jgi:hypothetical protein